MPLDTKTRLLNAAEKLFFEKGIDATSTRNIAEAAAANNAAPNFHFGSKGNLVKAVFERRMIPLNKRRLELAQELAEQGRLNDVESLIDVFSLPMFELLTSKEDGDRAFLGLLCRSTVEPIKDVEEVLAVNMNEYNQLYLTAFAKALPSLDGDELMIRIDFMIGAVAHACSDANRRSMMGISSKGMEPEYIYKALKKFLVAGFTA